MLNSKPIFLNCFSRGGSNIFWNLFLSHPHVCSPIEETLVIFRTDWRQPTLAGFAVAFLSGQPRFFDQWKLRDRRLLTRAAARYVDRTLFEWKMRTVTDAEMRFKRADEPYSEDEVRGSRLAAKHNNGLAFLVNPLRAMYPDATFFALVRHPLALYESHRRRQITRGPHQFASFFNRIASRMLRDSQQLECCHLVRFEDVLEDPLGTSERVLRLAGLDPSEVRQFRFKAKAHFRANGSYGTPLERNAHHWFDRSAMKSFLEPAINKLQEERVDAADVAIVMDSTAEVRAALDYR